MAINLAGYLFSDNGTEIGGATVKLIDSGGTRNYYVDIASASGLEYTGYDERGQSQVLLVEP